MDKNKMYKIKNRSASIVIYRIPEDRIRREFRPGEVKEISYGELVKLTYQEGGRELMSDFLQLVDDELIENFNIPAEAEYYMSEQQVVDLIKTGTLAAFLDCLDYAPTGVIDLIKRYAVSLPMTDLQKVAALKEKTGFDAAAAIANTQAEKAAEEAEGNVPAPKKSSSNRRTAANYKTTTATTESKYKVISEG